MSNQEYSVVGIKTLLPNYLLASSKNMLEMQLEKELLKSKEWDYQSDKELGFLFEKQLLLPVLVTSFA